MGFKLFASLHWQTLAFRELHQAKTLLLRPLETHQGSLEAGRIAGWSGTLPAHQTMDRGRYLELRRIAVENLSTAL